VVASPPPPRLAAAIVRRIALAAVAPDYDPAPVDPPEPPAVVSIRFAEAEGRRAWIVRLHAADFVFPNPACLPIGGAMPICVPSIARTVVVHVKDATGKAYSVVPVGG
jgi:hypothetical protein